MKVLSTEFTQSPMPTGLTKSVESVLEANIAQFSFWNGVNWLGKLFSLHHRIEGNLSGEETWIKVGQNTTELFFLDQAHFLSVCHLTHILDRICLPALGNLTYGPYKVSKAKICDAAE